MGSYIVINISITGNNGGRAIITTGYPYPILQTKLYVPRPGKGFVPRDRLANRILDERDKKLVLVSAPAGYGKTTLLSELVHQKQVRAAWISLDSRDSEPMRFISYLGAALEAAGIHALSSEPAVEEHVADDAPDIVLHGLIDRLADSDQDIFLMLDDYHSIDNLDTHRLGVLVNLKSTINLGSMGCRPPIFQYQES